MPLALELRSLRKRFSVGAGACLASAEVLRGVDLEVGAGESVAVVGASGAGKSTLLLCAAGLLKPESGELKWFGDTSRGLAGHRVHYYCSLHQLLGAVPNAEPQLHLLDFHAPLDPSSTIAPWIEDQCVQGDSVIVVARDEPFARRVATRVLTLSGGVLRSTYAAHARVAEHARL